MKLLLLSFLFVIIPHNSIETSALLSLYYYRWKTWGSQLETCCTQKMKDETFQRDTGTDLKEFPMAKGGAIKQWNNVILTLTQSTE